MGVRRQPTVDADLDAPPPHWLARRVYVRRLVTRDESGGVTYHGRPLDQALEHARRQWAEMTDERRAYWHSIDADLGPGWRGAEPCARHRQPWALCPLSCPTVAREQRDLDNR